MTTVTSENFTCDLGWVSHPGPSACMCGPETSACKPVAGQFHFKQQFVTVYNLKTSEWGKLFDFMEQQHKRSSGRIFFLCLARQKKHTRSESIHLHFNINLQNN